MKALKPIALRFVRSVVLFIDPQHLRSQRATEKVGGVRGGSGTDEAGRLVYRIHAPGRERGRACT